jgi:hypothetical protein
MRVTLWTTVIVLAAAPVLAADGWWTRQADLELASLTGSLEAQDLGGSPEFGAAGEAGAPGGNFGKAVPLLMSAILPGAGQVYLGLKQDRTGALLAGAGFVAADIFSWTQVFHNADLGDKKKDEYYAFADAHWSVDRLAAAYGESDDPGTEYFAFTDENGSPITLYTQIPLWVSAEADRREYYENLGKWNQFVFGWDDFTDPRLQYGWESGDPLDSEWLDNPVTSANRETYRQMRTDSNDYYDKRDRFIYLSIGLRVVSVLHVAYLEGLLFGGDGGDNVSKSVQFIAQPVGLRSGVFGATVAF